MLNIKIFSLYPDMFPGPLGMGLYKKAISKKIFSLDVINIRDYAKGKHKTVDDTPYGGGNGMIIKPDVVADALDKNIKKKKNRKLFIFHLEENNLIKKLQTNLVS